MYIIVVGAGSIGTSLIDIAVREKNNVVVIDRNADRAREVSNRYDITVLNANATSSETLREAGSERANALIVTSSDDAVNLMVVSIAVDLGIPSIVSIVNDPDHAEFFRKLGANVMENPEEVVAQHLYNAVKRPRVRDFAILSQGEQVFRIEVTGESPLSRRTIAEVEQRETIPATMQILAIERSGDRWIAEGATVVEAGDIVTIFSLDRVSDDLIEKLIG